MRDDTAEMFFDQGLATAQDLANKIPMKWLTQEQWKEYRNTMNFSICAKSFKSADKKVCDHPPGKYVFVEYSWNIPMIYSQNIWKKFPIKFLGIFPK